MSFLTDWQEFKEKGLDSVKNAANAYIDIQLENALNAEKLDMVDQDSGSYQISDDEREQQLANASIFTTDTIFGYPATYTYVGAAAALTLAYLMVKK